MTKQEKIKEAYQDQKVNPDENGWVECYVFDINFSSDWEYSEIREENEKHYRTAFKKRLKSLSGIENNNGWTKIESENDLPKGSGTHFFCNSQGVGKYAMNSYEIRASYKSGLVSHYQTVVLPNPPIY